VEFFIGSGSNENVDGNPGRRGLWRGVGLDFRFPVARVVRHRTRSTTPVVSDVVVVSFEAKLWRRRRFSSVGVEIEKGTGKKLT
jgi:hypothetical protein